MRLFQINQEQNINKGKCWKQLTPNGVGIWKNHYFFKRRNMLYVFWNEKKNFQNSSSKKLTIRLRCYIFEHFVYERALPDRGKREKELSENKNKLVLLILYKMVFFEIIIVSFPEVVGWKSKTNQFSESWERQSKEIHICQWFEVLFIQFSEYYSRTETICEIAY